MRLRLAVLLGACAVASALQTVTTVDQAAQVAADALRDKLNATINYVANSPDKLEIVDLSYTVQVRLCPSVNGAEAGVYLDGVWSATFDSNELKFARVDYMLEDDPLSVSDFTDNSRFERDYVNQPHWPSHDGIDYKDYEYVDRYKSVGS